MAAPYLIRRRAGYYLRVRIPSDLAPVLGTHLTRSLATKDHATARRRAVRAVALVGNVWDRVRFKMGGYWRDGEWRHFVDDVEDFMEEQRALAALEELEEVVPLETIKTYSAEEVAAIIKAVRADEQTNFAPIMSAAEKARLEGINEGYERALSKIGAVVAAPSSAPPHADFANDARLPISRHLDAFFVHQAVSKKTEGEYRTTYRKLIAALGDKAIGDVTEADLIAFFDAIPASVKPRGGRSTAAAGTQQKHATALKALFGWAASKKLCRDNLTGRLRVSKAAKKEAVKFQRRPFDDAELARIFDLPLFSGAQSEHYLRKPGKVLIRDHRFFFPLVALLTGGRLNELAQALLSDVKKCNGTPYLFITTEVDPEEFEEYTPEELEELKSLKTVNAKRCIPIHPVLRKLGFMEYVERRRAQKPKDGLLFPQAGYGQLYNQRILEDAKAKCATTSFHSFRHCYKDMVRGLVNNEELQNRLMGHAPKGAGGHYGSPLTPEEEKAFFGLKPAVSLVHLYAS